MERTIDPTYEEILADDTFVKTIVARVCLGHGTYDSKLLLSQLEQYKIPIPKFTSDTLYDPIKVLVIVDRLKDIAKDIDFEEIDTYGFHNAEAFNFFVLLEAIAGIRNSNRLAYLIFNEMFI